MSSQSCRGGKHWWWERKIMYSQWLSREQTQKHNTEQERVLCVELKTSLLGSVLIVDSKSQQIHSSRNALVWFITLYSFALSDGHLFFIWNLYVLSQAMSEKANANLIFYNIISMDFNNSTWWFKFCFVLECEKTQIQLKLFFKMEIWHKP